MSVSAMASAGYWSLLKRHDVVSTQLGQRIEGLDLAKVPEYQFFANDPFFAEMREEPRLVAIAAETRDHTLAERRKLDPVGAPN